MEYRYTIGARDNRRGAETFPTAAPRRKYSRARPCHQRPSRQSRADDAAHQPVSASLRRLGQWLPFVDDPRRYR